MMFMIRSLGVISIAVVACVQATTLEKLTLDEMIRQSTAIVHVKAISSSPLVRGRNIFTIYQLQTIENLKNGPQTEVAVPGGAAGGVRQAVPGAPTLTVGGEYVIFLWTGKSGLTQVIGLSQGLFEVTKDASGNLILVRPALAAQMVNRSGQAQTNGPETVSLSDLKTEIQRTGASK